jgi:uncharacterized protein (DUF302 family)
MTTTAVTIEHTTMEAKRSFEEVTRALEERLGPVENYVAIGQLLAAGKMNWEETKQAMELLMGTSGFVIFNKLLHGELLTLAGKPSRAYLYIIGNPLLAVQMTAQEPEAGLYAPTRLVVYEGHEGKVYIAYDRFTSQLAQYKDEEIARVAREVEEKLETLVSEAVGVVQ